MRYKEKKPRMNTKMNRSNRIIGGIAILAFGIVWALELAGLIHFTLDGWWTFFIIIPCFASLFKCKNKDWPLIGIGVGILLLLASRNIIPYNDLWKYIVCLVAVIWGLSLIFKNGKTSNGADHHTIDELKQINQNGRQIQKIDVSFGKQLYEFDGRHFEGAEVRTTFGFVELDLRNADIVDGTIVSIECSFGGMEIRVDKDICVKTAVETSFGGVECHCNTVPTEGTKTLYIDGRCNFGGIEIK